MGFYSQRCPNCGKSVSKDAEFCNACGCPTANSWDTCVRCSAAVGSESKFCWKCGFEQNHDRQRQFYGDRWHRSPDEFAVKVELKNAEATLHKGLQVDEGTVALIFQAGKFSGFLAPGYHTTEGFFSRLLGFEKGREAHAVLIDTQAAEVDFQLADIRLKNQIVVDARLRLLFQVRDPRLFAERMIGGASDFKTSDLSTRFEGDVRAAVQATAAKYTLDDLVIAPSGRDLLERELTTDLESALTPFGLGLEGVRLAEFGGPAVDELRSKLGEIFRLQKELEVNRQLQDAARAGKLSAYRDEQELKDVYAGILHKAGVAAAGREQEQKRFIQAAEHTTSLEGLRQDYEARRAEIINRLDEQKLRHQAEIADAMQTVELRKVEYAEDMRQQRERFGVAQEQQVVQSKTDLEVARQGIEALKLVQQTKLEHRQKNEEQDLAVEAERLKIRGGASMQALLATLTGEQGDRVLKLAELEMRRGLSAEQALALVAEKSPEIAPAVADALRAKYARGRDTISPEEQ